MMMLQALIQEYKTRGLVYNKTQLKALGFSSHDVKQYQQAIVTDGLDKEGLSTFQEDNERNVATVDVRLDDPSTQSLSGCSMLAWDGEDD
jgi:hypothetical protein